MMWQDFISKELVFLVVFVYIVGLFFKATPILKFDWLIPILLWIIGIVSAILVLLINSETSFTLDILVHGFIEGTFISAIAVFGNQVVKQVSTKRTEDK